jgi:23S rRNA (cytidine1920-2'-O)/16S rRNA (cytidine1409-2'-O)-methyltransferase
MPRRARVDAELVRRGLARSRQQAAELIGAGKVSIDGLPAVKPGTAVAVTAALTVADDGERSWVSRGAHKLIGALDVFEIPVAGRRCLDAGASTGGFTEVLLDRAAAQVVAADVGYGQLAWSLRSDPRVIVVERTNARDLSPGAIGGQVDLIVADLSFISLATVLPALAGCACPSADIVPMVKPQFEVGKSTTPGCAPTRCWASRSARGSWAGAPSTSRPVRYRDRRAMSNTSCGYVPRPIGGYLLMGWWMRCSAPLKRGRNDR